jgi:hypothetical protein
MLANGVQAQALHINGLTPHCDQTYSYIMTCNPCAGVADLKAICKDILKAVGPNSTNSYAALYFTEVDTEGGNNTWRHLLIRLDINNISHRRLRNVLLHQPDNFLSAGPPLQLCPWHEPPFNIQDLTTAIPAPIQDRTTSMVAAFIKARCKALSLYYLIHQFSSLHLEL